MGVNWLSDWPMAAWAVLPSVQSTPDSEWRSRYSEGLVITPVASESSTPVFQPRPKYSA